MKTSGYTHSPAAMIQAHRRVARQWRIAADLSRLQWRGRILAACYFLFGLLLGFTLVKLL